MKFFVPFFISLFGFSAFAETYSAEKIFNSLSVEEYVVDTGINVGAVTAKSIGGLTCIKNKLQINRTNYACGVDDANILQIMGVFQLRRLDNGSKARD